MKLKNFLKGFRKSKKIQFKDLLLRIIQLKRKKIFIKNRDMVKNIAKNFRHCFFLLRLKYFFLGMLIKSKFIKKQFYEQIFLNSDFEFNFKKIRYSKSLLLPIERKILYFGGFNSISYDIILKKVRNKICRIVFEFSISSIKIKSIILLKLVGKIFFLKFNFIKKKTKNELSKKFHKFTFSRFLYIEKTLNSRKKTDYFFLIFFSYFSRIEVNSFRIDKKSENNNFLSIFLFKKKKLSLGIFLLKYFRFFQFKKKIIELKNKFINYYYFFFSIFYFGYVRKNFKLILLFFLNFDLKIKNFKKLKTKKKKIYLLIVLLLPIFFFTNSEYSNVDDIARENQKNLGVLFLGSTKNRSSDYSFYKIFFPSCFAKYRPPLENFIKKEKILFNWDRIRRITKWFISGYHGLGKRINTNRKLISKLRLESKCKNYQPLGRFFKCLNFFFKVRELFLIDTIFFWNLFFTKPFSLFYEKIIFKKFLSLSFGRNGKKSRIIIFFINFFKILKNFFFGKYFYF